jgi:hypothetical protein
MRCRGCIRSKLGMCEVSIVATFRLATNKKNGALYGGFAAVPGCIEVVGRSSQS